MEENETGILKIKEVLLMLVIRIFLGTFTIAIGLLTGLWILEHYNLIEGEQPYDVPFPFVSLLITVALIILIMIL